MEGPRAVVRDSGLADSLADSATKAVAKDDAPQDLAELVDRVARLESKLSDLQPDALPRVLDRVQRLEDARMDQREDLLMTRWLSQVADIRGIIGAELQQMTSAQGRLTSAQEQLTSAQEQLTSATKQAQDIIGQNRELEKWRAEVEHKIWTVVSGALQQQARHLESSLGDVGNLLPTQASCPPADDRSLMAHSPSDGMGGRETVHQHVVSDDRVGVLDPDVSIAQDHAAAQWADASTLAVSGGGNSTPRLLQVPIVYSPGQGQPSADAPRDGQPYLTRYAGSSRLAPSRITTGPTMVLDNTALQVTTLHSAHATHELRPLQADSPQWLSASPSGPMSMPHSAVSSPRKHTVAREDKGRWLSTSTGQSPTNTASGHPQESSTGSRFTFPQGDADMGRPSGIQTALQPTVSGSRLLQDSIPGSLTPRAPPGAAPHRPGLLREEARLFVDTSGLPGMPLREDGTMQREPGTGAAGAVWPAGRAPHALVEEPRRGPAPSAAEPLPLRALSDTGLQAVHGSTAQHPHPRAARLYHQS